MGKKLISIHEHLRIVKRVVQLENLLKQLEKENKILKEKLVGQEVYYRRENEGKVQR